MIDTCVYVCVAVLGRQDKQVDTATKKKQKTIDGHEQSHHQDRGGASEFGIMACWGDADRERGVTHVEACCTDPSRVLVSRKNGSTEVLDIDTGSMAWCHENDGLCCASAHWIPGYGEEERVVRVMEHGTVQVFSLDGTAEDPLVEWTCPPKAICSAYNASSRKLAVGCEGAELKVYAVSDTCEGGGAQCFAGKGGKPNSVGLCDRPCTSAVAFDPSVEDGTRVLVGTGSSKVRFYDAKAGKRPQRDIPFKGFKITCLAPEQDGQRCWVGDGGGNLQVYDVRAGKFSGAISGIGGSVRSMDIHHGAIVSGGLDRFLRINSLRSRASIEKVYMKSQMTSVCWSRTIVMASKQATRKKSQKKRIQNS